MVARSTNKKKCFFAYAVGHIALTFKQRIFSILCKTVEMGTEILSHHHEIEVGVHYCSGFYIAGGAIIQ